jgi:hypothetical protein
MPANVIEDVGTARLPALEHLEVLDLSSASS